MIVYRSCIQNQLTVKSCHELFDVKPNLSKRKLSASLGNVNVNTIDFSPNNWSHEHSTGSIDSMGLKEPECDYAVSINVPSIIKGPPKDSSEHTSSSDQPVKLEKPSMTPQEIAKWIDRRSRIAFPTMFTVANLFYWYFVLMWNHCTDYRLNYLCYCSNLHISLNY